MDNNKLKSEADKLTFERHLGLLKAATAKLEEMLLPFMEQNTPISEMPCRFPNSISWGRYCYQKNLAKLEEVRREREKKKRGETIKKTIRKKK